jgi:integrase
MLNMLTERTHRPRTRAGTRYPEPLPLSTPVRLLSVETRDYLNDMGRKNRHPNTITSTAQTLTLLKKVCEDVPVNRIKHQHIYRLWDLLRWASPKVISEPGFDKATVEELIAQGEAVARVAPANATLERHRRFLNAFFNALVRHAALIHSPMAGFDEVKEDLVRDPDQAERFFDENDLRRIFHKDTFVPWASKYPHRWWAPMIGLYTGARISEVAQMKVADVVEQKGVLCFAIRKTIDADLPKNARVRSRQTLKGKSSERFIPVAQPLIDAGFLDFMEDIKASGSKRLFPHLSAGVNRKTGESNARYSQGLLNQWGTYLSKLNIPSGVRFHAFRHTLVTELDGQDVRVEDVALLTGHSVSKKVPVLETSYTHRSQKTVRSRQTQALGLYQPKVQLPVYVKGQFAAQLRDKTKFYP